MSNVLIVHASPDDRAMYADFLGSHGLTLIECSTTDEALAGAPQADIVITGLMVPGSFDGLELVKRLRAADATRNQPIIVLTTIASEEHVEAARDAGCNRFLPKPCLPDTLLAEVQQLLAASRVPG